MRAARGIASGKRTNGNQGGGPKLQGLGGQSVTKAGQTLNVNRRHSQRSVMRYDNLLVSCTNPMSGGVGNRGGQGGLSLFNRMDGVRCRRRKGRPEFGGGSRVFEGYGDDEVESNNSDFNTFSGCGDRTACVYSDSCNPYCRAQGAGCCSNSKPIGQASCCKVG